MHSLGPSTYDAGADTGLVRHEKLRQRNRRAQKRYRQKKMDEAEVARGLRERLSLDLALAAAQTEELRQDKQALQAQLASLNNCTGSSVLTGLTSRLEPTPVLQDEQRRDGLQAGCGLPIARLQLLAQAFAVIRGGWAHELLKDCSYEKAHELYQETVRFLADCLALEQDGMAKLNTAVPLLVAYNQEAMREKPQRTLVLRSMQGPVEHFVDIQQWQRLHDAADLTEAQREQLGVRKALLYASLRPVLEIRRAALQALQGELPSNACLSDEATDSFLRACAMSQQLQHCLEEEQKAVCDFAFGIMQQVLSPWQQAQLIVRSQPQHVNMLAFVLAALGQLETASDLESSSELWQSTFDLLGRGSVDMTSLLGLHHPASSDSGQALFPSMSDAESPFGQDLSDLLEFDDADSAFHEHGFLRHPDTQLLTQQHLPAAENGSTRPLTDMQIEAYLLHNDMPWLGVY